ncbi:MAG: glycosyltransferase [Candidatus Micrarchaeia archaeon]|jgi:1,2-diacylglycerol 3-alpha-glucosyltransferase
MRVGFFSDTYYPNVDGVVSAMMTYRRELERRGDKVYIFSARPAGADTSDKSVYFYDSVVFPPYPQYRLAIFPYMLTARARKAKLDLVHSHAITTMGLASIKAARDLKVPLVGTFHTMIPIAAKYYTRKNPVARFLADKLLWGSIKAFYGPFQVVTAPTQVVCDILQAHGIEKTFRVPNGVDTERFSPKVDPMPVRKILGIKPGERVIVSAGRMSFEKNVNTIVHACKELEKDGEDFRLVITGDGPAFGSIRKLVSELGLSDRTVMPGFCRPYELPFYYAAADVFVTASTFETQGLAMLEAMSCGKPVVGADSLAIPETVKDNYNGYLFEPLDSSDCAAKLSKAINASPARKAAMSKAARRTAEGLSVEKSTDRLLEAYSLVM